MKRYHLIKEVTCPVCKGLGFNHSEGEFIPRYDLDYIKDMIEGAPDKATLAYWKSEEAYFKTEYMCDCCKGKGYVVDAVDKVTGYRIIGEEY